MIPFVSFTLRPKDFRISSTNARFFGITLFLSHFNTPSEVGIRSNGNRCFKSSRTEITDAFNPSNPLSSNLKVRIEVSYSLILYILLTVSPLSSKTKSTFFLSASQILIIISTVKFCLPLSIREMLLFCVPISFASCSCDRPFSNLAETSCETILRLECKISSIKSPLKVVLHYNVIIYDNSCQLFYVIIILPLYAIPFSPVLLHFLLFHCQQYHCPAYQGQALR